ncbi:MAG: SapC family protein, partial [Beijerinckiaceae bacterium]
MTADIRFLKPPEPGAPARWRAVTRHGWLGALGLLPVADRELLNVAHHAPLVVLCGVGEPCVQMLLHPDLLRRAPVDRLGRWRPAYRPMALRALPFLLLDPAASEMRTAIIGGIPDDELGAPSPYFGDAGLHSEGPDVALRTLVQLHEGARTLGGAAEALLAAGLLSPLTLAGEAGRFFASMELLVPDTRKIQALTPARTAALMRNGRLPLDLVFASHFSTRLLSASVRPAGEPAAAGSGLSLEFDGIAAEVELPDVGLDVSGLFS